MASIVSSIPDVLAQQRDSRPRAGCGNRIAGRPPMHFVLAFVLSMLICAWFVTWGDWTLFEAERFCGFYDAQMRSLLHGRFDVPPAAIGFEAFIRDRKSYGYYGIAPSLLRLPLLLAFPSVDGRWARLMMLAACALNLIYAWRLVRLASGSAHCQTAAGKATEFLFILCAGIGSTNVFMLSRSYTYHEAIMWGATFGLMCGYYVARYLMNPSFPTLALAGLFAFLSFHSRPTTGAGALLAICVLAAALLWQLAIHALRGRERDSFHALFFSLSRYSGGSERNRRLPASGLGWGSSFLGAPGANPHPNPPPEYRGRGQDSPQLSRTRHGTSGPPVGLAHPASACATRLQRIPNAPIHALLACTLIFITLATYFAVNYGRFRTLDGVPVRYYGLYLKNTDRMRITAGRQIHPHNLLTGIATYLGPGGLSVGREFPWVYMSRAPRVIGEPTIDVVEPYSSLPVSMPGMCLLAMLGCMTVLGKSAGPAANLRLPIISLLLGGGIMLMSVGITERYLHDFYPALILAGAAGVGRIATKRRTDSNGVHPSTRTPLLATGRTAASHFAESGLLNIRLTMLAILVVWSISLNCAFAIEFQRDIVWGVPDAKRMELAHIRQRFDQFLHLRTRQ